MKESVDYAVMPISVRPTGYQGIINFPVIRIPYTHSISV